MPTPREPDDDPVEGTNTASYGEDVRDQYLWDIYGSETKDWNESKKRAVFDRESIREIEDWIEQGGMLG